MSFWSKLTGSGRKTSAELSSEAEAYLRGLEQEILINPKSEMKQIMKRPKRFEPLFDFGGQFHARFVELVLKGIVWKKGGASFATAADLPSVGIVTDHDVTTFGQIFASEAVEKEIIFVRFLKDWPADTLAAIEAVYELATDPSALFIIHSGPDNIFMRKNHLLSVRDAFSLDFPLTKTAEELFLHGEVKDNIDYDDYVVSAHGYAFCKFFQEPDKK